MWKENSSFEPHKSPYCEITHQSYGAYLCGIVSHCVSLCMTFAASASFLLGRFLPLVCVSFLWRVAVIRAADLNRFFHTHSFAPSSAWPLIFAASLMFCRFELKRCWPLKNCQQSQSTLAFIVSNHRAGVKARVRTVCQRNFMMYLLIMGNASLCSDSF